MNIRRKNIGDKIFDSINYFILFTTVVITFYPFVYIFFYSISIPGRISNEILLYPKGFTLASYIYILSNKRLVNSFLVSAARTILGPTLMIIITAQAAYALSIRKLVFRKFFNRYFLITMYVSAGLIPGYMLIHYLHLNGTFWVYIIPNLFGGAFSLILIRTYIEQMPPDLIDSARIDGANNITIFYRIIFPLITPVTAAVFLMSAVGHWNSYFDTMLYNAGVGNLHVLQYTLMLSLQKVGYGASMENTQLAQLGFKEQVNSMTLQTATTVVTIIPVLFIYPLLQKYFVKGLLIGSVKA